MCVAASTLPWSLRDWVRSLRRSVRPTLGSARGDWTQWRGPARDGVIASFTPPATWPDALVKRWNVEIGTGYATPIVVGDRVYQFSRIGENETMTAFDAATGKQLWQGEYPAEFTMNSVAAAHGKGPKSTPTFFDNRLYSIGMTGTVTAWDAASGKPLWRKPGDPKNVPATTTHAFSPLVEGGSVIFHLGGDNNGALTAFDLVSGTEKWKWTGDGPGYGSPVITEVAGVRQLVTITQGKVVGLEASTGALLWERPFVSPAKINAMTPVVSRGHRHRFRQRLAIGRLHDRPHRHAVEHRDGLGEHGPSSVVFRRGHRRGRADRLVSAQQRAVRRRRPDERQDAVDLRAAAGGQERAAARRQSDLHPGSGR